MKHYIDYSRVSENLVLQMLADRSRWPSSLRRRSTAARLLGSRVRIQLRAWTSVSCVCCMLCVASVTGWSLVQRSTNVCVCV